MPLKLSPMLWEDIDDFGLIDELAMKQWTFAQLMDTSGRPRREFAAEWARSDWGKDEKAHWLKVVDTDNGEMIAMAMWRLPVQNPLLGSRQSNGPADAEGEIETKAVSEAEARTKKFWAEVENLKKGFFQEFIGERVHACKSTIYLCPSTSYSGIRSSLTGHTSIPPPSRRRQPAGKMGL